MTLVYQKMKLMKMASISMILKDNMRGSMVMGDHP
jgi:hypothetical protein